MAEYYPKLDRQGNIMSDWLNLKDKVVIVTGGASGIGYAIVEELLTAGAKVQLADVNPLEGEIKNNPQLNFIQLDISDRNSVQAAIDNILAQHGHIDALVNNAGINLPRLLVDPKQSHSQYELKDNEFEKMVNVNQKGVYLMSQAVARNMIENKNGVIINLTSESGLEGSEGQSCYAATKAALYSFTRSWAKELGKYGIRVVGVAPGILEKTGLRTLDYEEALAYTRNITVEQLRDGYTKNAIPIGRAGKLSEIADFVTYLLSERASYITGVTYNIAGGKTRG
ncbi:Sorbitol-6-phosphate 2-dehydrogenase [Yersinia kristensenii ATCC 33638]|nr:Sorbitol-6-phosphate 2-dehydrogenase [Yersinia kristensenii ATCC 33638]